MNTFERQEEKRGILKREFFETFRYLVEKDPRRLHYKQGHRDKKRHTMHVTGDLLTENERSYFDRLSISDLAIEDGSLFICETRLDTHPLNEAEALEVHKWRELYQFVTYNDTLKLLKLLREDYD